MSSKPGLVVIVDAYSSGADLASAFRARGHSLVHVKSSAAIPEHFLRSYRAASFDEDWLLGDEGQVEGLAAMLATRSPVAVVAGTETGVPLADDLAERLGVPGNGTVLSPARRDKFLMIERLRQTGLRVAQHLATSDVDEGLAWIAANGGYPKVIKPLASAGSDGVRVCRDDHEVNGAAAAILGGANKLGLENRSILIEELITGEEYYMNAVSARGRHVVTDFGISRRIVLASGAIIYDALEQLPFSDPAFAELEPYFFACLDALGIVLGPTHGELKIDSRGPCLIEVGARLPGAGLAGLASQTVPYGSLAATIDAYTDPNRFFERSLSAGRSVAFGRVVFLIEHVARGPNENSFAALKSFHGWYPQTHDAATGEGTEDLFTSPGLIHLLHHDPVVLEEDHRRIRELEANFRTAQ